MLDRHLEETRASEIPFTKENGEETSKQASKSLEKGWLNLWQLDPRSRLAREESVSIVTRGDDLQVWSNSLRLLMRIATSNTRVACT